MNNPSIVFNIADNEIVVLAGEIVKGSIEIHQVLYNDLKPTTSKASFTIKRGSGIVATLLSSSQREIAIIIKEGSDTVFTGYLTDSYNWDITSRGEDDIKLTAEDPGIKKLKVSWKSNGALPATTLFDQPLCDASTPSISVVHHIASLAGVVVNSSVPTINKLVDVLAEDNSTTYWEVLEKLLFDFGYVFYFNTDGELSLYNLAHESIDIATTINSSKLISDGGIAVKIQKKLRQYNQTRIKWTERETIANERVFEDVTGGDEAFRCNITMEADGYYPINDPSSEAMWLDFASIDRGKELIRVSNPQFDILSDASISHAITPIFLPTRAKFLLHNSSTQAASIRRLIIRGDAVVVKSHNVSIAGEASAKPFEYEAKYVRQKVDASYLANLIVQYYKHCNYTYRFSATTELDVGDIATINDDAFTGLLTEVLITKKITSDHKYFTYEAHGITQFNLITETIVDKIVPANAVQKGERGEGYSVDVESDNGFVFKTGEITPINLTARVRVNGVDITDALPASRFIWRKRSFYDTSGDAAWNAQHYSGYKSIQLILSSVTGRATYYCDILDE